MINGDRILGRQVGNSVAHQDETRQGTVYQTGLDTIFHLRAELEKQPFLFLLGLQLLKELE